MRLNIAREDRVLHSLPGVIMMMAALCWLFGCERKSAAPVPSPTAKVADLKFPVMVIHNNTSIKIEENADELQQMHVNYASAPKTWPMLIDSQFNIYTMENLHSTKSGLWLMANPSGITPVEFDLKRAPESGLKPAIDLIVQCKYLGSADPDDNERKRKEIALQTTFAGIAAILESESTPPENAASQPSSDSE